jgi:hypothetical protein
VRCGYDLKASAAKGAAQPLPPSVVRLVACPQCGASNAGSRTVCGRCRATLDPDAEPDPSAASPSEPPEIPLPSIVQVEPESSRLLLIVTAVAGLMIGAVLLVLLANRWFGILSQPVATTPAARDAVRMEVKGVSASSMLPPAGLVTYAAENVVDNDPTTAWNEGARGAVGEWVELRLAHEARISRLLVWNGYQKGVQFAQSGRVKRLLIEAGGRRFTVELLDVRGSQAVDLPQPVRARTIRLTIEAIFQGDRYPDTALSEVEVYGYP